MTSKKEVRISELIIKKYAPVFNDKEHKHIILTSGRAGTKSSFVGIMTPYLIVSDDNASAVVLRKRHNKLRKTVYKEILRGINRLQINKKKFHITKSPMEIRYKKNDSTIYFAGSDGIDDTKGIIDESKPIKLVVLDELTEFFDDGEGEDELANIEATFVRGNDAGFQMVYLYNPPKNPNAPINKWCKKMEKRPDCIHIHSTYLDVPETWLGRDLIESAEVMKQIDEKMYNWTWLGESIGVDELIYYMYGQSCRLKVDKEQKYALGAIGVDYGQMNATTYQAFGLNMNKKRLEGLGEYYHSGRETGKQKSPSEYASDFCNFVKALHEKFGVKQIYVFIDPSAKGLQEEIRRKALMVLAPRVSITFKAAENKVDLGIQRVQTALSYGVLKISPQQSMADEEFGLYEYNKKLLDSGKEEPIKDNDHCMDAIRYVVMGMWNKIKIFLPKVERGD